VTTDGKGGTLLPPLSARLGSNAMMKKSKKRSPQDDPEAEWNPFPRYWEDRQSLGTGFNLVGPPSSSF